MLRIKKCYSSEIYFVRHQVLRKNRPFETAFFDGDDLKTTNHFGLSIENNIVGVVSGFKIKNPLLNFEKQCQVRGMALLENHQKKGYGNELLNYLENYYESQKHDIIWLNARENAVPFYKKMGYIIKGTVFEIKDVGLHYLMYKKL